MKKSQYIILFLGILFIATLGDLSAQTIIQKRIPNLKNTISIRSAKIARLILKPDFVVRNVTYQLSQNCTDNEILKVSAQVWNIGDADYDASIKRISLYFDIYNADDKLKCIYFGGAWIPSIKKGKYVKLSLSLERRWITSPGDFRKNFNTSKFIKFVLIPNIDDGFIPEKDFTNNEYTSPRIFNSCYGKFVSKRKPLLPIKKKK